MNKYQLNYSFIEPAMYNKSSREIKALRIVKLLRIYFGKNKIKKLSVLDLGCSSGIIDNFLSRYFNRVVGIDIDKNAIRFAKRRFEKRNLKFQTGNALNLKFKDNSFDVIICTHVYEHVPDAKKLFKEVYRVLKTNGVCYFAAVNKYWIVEPHYDLPFLSWLPKNVANVYLRIFKKEYFYYENPKNYWELRRLTNMFKVNDFTKKIIDNPSKYGYTNEIISNPILKPFIKLAMQFYFFITPTFFWILVKED